MAPRSKKSSRKKKRSARSSVSLRDVLATGFRWTLVIGLWAAIGLGAVIAFYAAELPSIIEKPGFERKPAVTVHDINGHTIARYGELKGNNVDVSELPPHVVYAVLAIEDRRFYQHFGVDPVGLLRAMVRNTIEGRVVQGGSTITQQLAKNLFLSRDRTLKRKIQEALLALWLEARLTKDQILSAYLNRVYLGAGTYGVEAAAHTYFNKSARELSLRESAVIAGLLKAPSRYSPLSNPRLSSERADVVLAAMEDAGYLTKEQAGKLIKTPPTPTGKPTEGTGDSAKYFADWVTGDLDELIGTPNEDITIETTLIPEIQDAAEKAVARMIAEEGKDKNVSQGAVIVMARDGAVLAMVGGKNYGESQFNRATQAYRQPGSSFKPIVYLTALEHGYTPDTIVIDERITTGRYRPTNFNGEYYGEVPLSVALAYSLNTISYQIAKQVGIGYVIGTARRLGIEAELQRDLSLALGSSGVPMLQMATAYATIANDGYQVKPYAIREITDKDGTLIYQRPPRNVQSGRAMFEPYLMRDLKSMMRGVTEFGTGQGARFGPPIAGKTGTSQDFRDAWFIGFSDTFIAAAWVGNDDNSSMKRVTGGSMPIRIWRDSMVAAHNSEKGRRFSTSSLDAFASDSAYPSADAAAGQGPNDFGDLLRRLLTTSSAEQSPSSIPQVRFDNQPSSSRSGGSMLPTGRTGDWKFND